MKKLGVSLIVILMFGCGESSTKHFPNVDVSILTQSFESWWAYYHKNIDLSLDFDALDTEAKQISKKVFLEKLSNENIIAIKLVNDESEKPMYQLIAISDESILQTSKQEAKLELQYYEKEGAKFPAFAYTDLKGGVITSKNTVGKLVVIKVWFIQCKACVEEFPALNALTQKYSNRDKIVFVSLAYDEKEQLKDFLSKNVLNYQNAHVSSAYITEEMNVQIFPTHFIIDEHGKILKIFNDAKRLAAYLEYYLPNQ